MDEKTRELIAIGASVSGHCTPCLANHIAAASKQGIQPAEIEQAIAIGHTVAKGAFAAMKKVTGAAEAALSTGAAVVSRSLKIYDPAMCCSSGVCGPSVDPKLAEFAGVLLLTEKHPGVEVKRFNLSQEPQAFVDNPRVSELLARDGADTLPFIYLDDELLCQGRYPERAELCLALGIDESALDVDPLATVADACCDGGQCC